MSRLESLRAAIDAAGGIEIVSSYLGLDADVLDVALQTPPSPGAERVAKMVAENTEKLAGMPSQRGFFWRLTRKRVVKDWLILARMGLNALPSLERGEEGLTNEQRRRLDLLAKIGL